MTSKISIIVLAVLLFITPGCSDWLELKPEDSIVLEDYWQDESQVNQALAGCYSSMTEYGYMERVLVWGELRSDNVTKNNLTGSEMSKVIDADLSPNNGLCSWGDFYRTINYCNTFLYYAPGVVAKDPNFTESELHAMEAEALTIRALSYFYLVRAFRDVPWVETPSIDDDQDYKLKKSDEGFILEKLISDLQTALQYARGSFADKTYNKGKITRNAVRALLADIYLWQGDFTNCIATCDQILTDTEQGLKLVNGKDVLLKVFGAGNSSESIFELQYDNKNNINKVVRNLYGYKGKELGQWSFPIVLLYGTASPFNYLINGTLESEKDLRLKDFLLPVGDMCYVFKYAGASREDYGAYSKYNYRSVTANWIFYRLSDIMLMKAEALIESETNTAEAIRLINTVYMRSNPEETNGGLLAENYITKMEQEKLLYRERQRELMFEGKRWFDLMRLARRANSTSPLLNYVMKKYSGAAGAQAAKMAVMDALYWPILSNELDRNPNLEQNPFYKIEGETLK